MLREMAIPEVSTEALVAAGLRTVPDLSIILFDREQRIIAVHGGALERHGYDPELMVGRQLADVVPAPAWTQVGPLYARALAGETVVEEIVTQDRTAVYESTFAPVERDGAVVGGSVTSRDITAQRERDDLGRLWELSFRTMTRGVVLVEPRTARIIQANPAFAEMHGGTPDDFAGLPIADTLAANAGSTLAEVARGLDAQDRIRFETEHVRLDGTVFPVEVEIAVARDAAGEVRVRVATVTDLTAQRAREASERAAVEQFERAFLEAPIGMCLVAPDGRFLRVNAALCALLERSEEQLLAGDFQHLTHPDDLDADLALLQETIDGRRDGYELAKRYLRPDGGVIHARLSVSIVREPDGTPRHVIAQIADLTALTETREALERANVQLQAILDNSPMAIYLRDLDQRWEVVNPETCRIIGMPAEELVGRSMRETQSPELFEHLDGHDQQVLASGTAMSFEEVAPDARTGETHYWWSLKFPVRDASGEIVGLGGVSLDVTAREQAQRELTAARELFQSAFDRTPVGMMVTRLAGEGHTEILRVNEGMARMLGRDPDELIGTDGGDLVHPDDADERRRMMREMLAGRTVSAEMRFRHRDGHDVWVLVVPALVADAEGEQLFVLQALDIGERKRFESQLRHLADHDALTGMFSRRRFDEELTRELARVRRSGEQGCLLLLDLDGFKYVNDTFGHSAGDELLTRVAGALRATLREVDVTARIGGDEFAVILPDTDLEGGRRVAAKLVEGVRAAGQVVRGGRHAEVTTSVGVTTITGTEGQDAEELLVEADIAMYEAKDDGKNRAAVYERARRPRDRLTRRTEWVGRLRDAMRDQRFELHAQPIVPLAGADRREHHELLLRLRGDDGNLVPPNTFLYHAERDGLIVDIDRWVARQAIGRLAAAHAAGRDLVLAVNFSARTAQDPMIVRDLEAMLDAQPIPPGTLMVEITETAAITNVARAAELARQLRGLGCRLALDDFGAGFASFYYLKHLVFDVLKIDGDFIDRLPTSVTDQLVVRAVVDIARGLGAEVVAERVGGQATVDLLTELGVDYGQGFYLGRPRPLR